MLARLGTALGKNKQTTLLGGVSSLAIVWLVVQGQLPIELALPMLGLGGAAVLSADGADSPDVKK